MILPSKYLDRTFIKGISFGLVARNIIMLRSAQNKIYRSRIPTTDSQQVTGFGTHKISYLQQHLMVSKWMLNFNKKRDMKRLNKF